MAFSRLDIPEHCDKPDGEAEVSTVLKEEWPVFQQFLDMLLARSDTDASEWVLLASGH